MYDDGLVRIATELYSEEPDSILDPCIHVTNYDINRTNKLKPISKCSQASQTVVGGSVG